MNDLPPDDPGSVPEPESTPPPAKLFLGSPANYVANPSAHFSRPFTLKPEPDPPFWTYDWFKFLVFALIVGGVGGWLYYNFYWLVRLPQERNLTDLQGKTMHVQLLAHDDLLLKYATPGSVEERYLPLATLSWADQDFIAKLSSTPLAQLPLVYLLTDAGGKDVPVRLVAHDDNWAQYTLISDGSTHYVFLPSLAATDQAVIRLLPSGMTLRYPMDYVFSGPPEAGSNIRILGHDDNTVEYLDSATGKKFFMALAQLSVKDQSFVRELPSNMPDRPGRDIAGVTVQDQPQAVAITTTPARPDGSVDGPLPTTMLNALVIVKGDYSEGSGFIAKIKDQYFVVTNQHVLSGNKDFTITGMDGREIPSNGPLYAAVGYDVVILKIPDAVAKSYLEILTDPQTNAKVGDRVTICGNSLGAEVPAQINGQLVAVGPQLVEVSANLEHGISGSPIIDRPQGKVVGIATMSITYKVDVLTQKISTLTRWFGYRVDNVDPTKGWVKLDWARFRDEGIKVRNAEELYQSLAALLENKPATQITNEIVQSAINDFQTKVSLAVAHRNKQELQDAYLAFSSRLRSLADGGTDNLEAADLYPYHGDLVKQLDDVRKFMDAAFEDDKRQFQNIVNAQL